MCQFVFVGDIRKTHWEKIVSSIIDFGQTEYPSAKRNVIVLIAYIICTVQLKTD